MAHGKRLACLLLGVSPRLAGQVDERHRPIRCVAHMAVDLSVADLGEGVEPWSVVGIGVELNDEGLNAVPLGILPVPVQASAIVGYPLLPRLLRVLPQGDRFFIGPDVPEAGYVHANDNALRNASCPFGRQRLHDARAPQHPS